MHNLDPTLCRRAILRARSLCPAPRRTAGPALQRPALGTGIPAASLFSPNVPISMPFTRTRYCRAAATPRNTTTGLRTQTNGLVMVKRIWSSVLALE
jgi:hypothetical protein